MRVAIVPAGEFLGAGFRNWEGSGPLRDGDLPPWRRSWPGARGFMGMRTADSKITLPGSVPRKGARRRSRLTPAGDNGHRMKGDSHPRRPPSDHGGFPPHLRGLEPKDGLLSPARHGVGSDPAAVANAVLGYAKPVAPQGMALGEGTSKAGVFRNPCLLALDKPPFGHGEGPLSISAINQ